ncbi:MAG: threonyl-tRNA synthetase editing domain-containing protein [Candidatus Helarchaeota archaeon]
MRFLSFHVEYFKYKVTKRGRSKVYEEVQDEQKEGHVENAVVLFTSFDKQDEQSPTFLERGIAEIEKIITQLKIQNIVLLPFAHLFGDLSSPQFALNTFRVLHAKLQERGYQTLRLPFGWFNELELKAKGHPLSRISRIVK